MDARGGNRNEVAERDLRRYYELLRDGLREVEMSAGEVSLIVDACNGWWIDEQSYCEGLLLQVEDAIADQQLDRKWGVSAVELLGKLKVLSPAARLALCDAVERFWLAPNPLNDALMRVGLLAAEVVE